MISEPKEDILLDTLLREKKYRRFQRRTALFQNEYIPSPFTSGIFRHRIILPERELNERERRYIYLHELSHICNYDVLMKLLGLIAIALNWYNPCAYLLFLRSEKISEYASDEHAIKDMGADDRRAYSILMIQLAQKDFPQYRLVKNFAASRAKKQLKERIEHMNKLKKSKIVTRVLSSIFVAVIIFSCALTASAYEPAHTVVVNDNITKYISPDSSDFYFSESDETSIRDSFLGSIHLDFSESDTLIIDADGNVTPYLPSDIEPHVLCFHKYKPCNVTKHTRNSSGGCTLILFSGEQCQICGQLLLHEKLNSCTYEKCPH